MVVGETSGSGGPLILGRYPHELEQMKSTQPGH